MLAQNFFTKRRMEGERGTSLQTLKHQKIALSGAMMRRKESCSNSSQTCWATEWSVPKYGLEPIAGLMMTQWIGRSE
jgi:hypothetical protein